MKKLFILAATVLMMTACGKSAADESLDKMEAAVEQLEKATTIEEASKAYNAIDEIIKDKELEKKVNEEEAKMSAEEKDKYEQKAKEITERLTKAALSKMDLLKDVVK